MIRFAIPSGSLQNRTIELLHKAGFPLPNNPGRSDFAGETGGYSFYIRDRSRIASMVDSGTFDVGITGSDLRVNEGLAASKIGVVCTLCFSRSSNQPSRWVLAGPPGFEWSSADSLTIGTERIGLAQYCLAKRGILSDRFQFQKLEGKEESSIADGLCGAVFVVTESGSSLKAHGLEILEDNLFVSTPELLIKPNADFGVIERVAGLGMALQAVLEAEKMAVLTFNLPADKVSFVDLQADVSPTLSQTADPAWLAGQVLLPKNKYGDALLRLKRLGARGIFMQEVSGFTS